MDRSDGSFCLVDAVCWYAENAKIAVRKSTFLARINKTHKLKRIDKESEWEDEEGQWKDDWEDQSFWSSFVFSQLIDLSYEDLLRQHFKEMRKITYQSTTNHAVPSLVQLLSLSRKELKRNIQVITFVSLDLRTF